MPFPDEPPDGTRLVIVSPRLGERVWRRNDAVAHQQGHPDERWFADDYRHAATWTALVVCAIEMYRLERWELT